MIVEKIGNAGSLLLVEKETSTKDNGIEGAKQKDDEKDESEEFLKRDYQIE